MLTSAVCIEELRISTHWMALDGGAAWGEITLHITNYRISRTIRRTFFPKNVT